MIVTEIRQFRISAKSKDEALSKRHYGEGELVSSQDIVDEEGKPPPPIPSADWPLWAKALRQFRAPKDSGIGDVAARIIGAENSEAFKAWFKATFGKDCGCTGRHREWNLKYPL